MTREDFDQNQRCLALGRKSSVKPALFSSFVSKSCRRSESLTQAHGPRSLKTTPSQLGGEALFSISLLGTKGTSSAKPVNFPMVTFGVCSSIAIAWSNAQRVSSCNSRSAAADIDSSLSTQPPNAAQPRVRLIL